jgi:MlaC protein
MAAMTRALVTLAAVLALLVARDAAAGVPTDQLRGSIDLVLKIVTDHEQFVALFGDLLENAYVAKIESYSGEKIEYPGDVIEGDLAVVKTRIVTKQQTEIPVDYRMFLQNGRWAVYDVSIEGISLIGNYRTQFNAVINRSGYPELVAKLKAKADERPGAREAGRREAPAPAATVVPVSSRQAP